MAPLPTVPAKALRRGDIILTDGPMGLEVHRVLNVESCLQPAGALTIGLGHPTDRSFDGDGRGLYGIDRHADDRVIRLLPDIGA